MASKYAKVDAKYYCWYKKLAQFILMYFILYPYFKIFYRMEVHGRENIPKGKSVILAANHLSYFDPLVVSAATRRFIAYMAKEELFHVPFISQIIQILGAFAVNRKNIEVATIKSAKSVLTTKWNLGIFPEGTRVSTGKIGNVHKGFGYIAQITKSEIVPIGITGSNTFCGKLIVKIGKPIPVPSTPEEAIDKWANAISELTGLEYDKKEAPSEEFNSEPV